jgi:hypothetical protein
MSEENVVVAALKPWRSRSREREERGRLSKATLLKGPSSMRAVVTTARI